MQDHNVTDSEQSIHDFDFALICDYFSTLGAWCKRISSAATSHRLWQPS